MSPERWRRVQEIFHDALAAPRDERRAVVDAASRGDSELVAQVEVLLSAHDEATTFVDRPVISWRDEAANELPEAIGTYRPLAILGRGGMGIVYLAERADETFDKKIALKVVSRELATPELARRFRAERQILADLEHPGIARLLDGGTTDDGRPYLVMEYVDGLPVDRYVEDKALDLDARLDLFCAICSAVHTAHQNLVVHRDLKPGNILVTAEGQPKLLDFGIAKLLAAEEPAASGGLARHVEPGATRVGARLMTPSYASPEQIAGGVITTASDVYALGVLLYEMLTGQTPFSGERGEEDGAATVFDERPESPSRVISRRDPTDRLAGSVRGDLDHIVLTALQPAPEKRYASAEALAADVERFVRRLPIEARPQTFAYRARRFVGRHRWGVTAALVILAILSTLTITNVVQSWQTARQRDRAEAISGFMIYLFENASPRHARGEEITVRELLDEGARELARSQQPPDVIADLSSTMGEAYLGLGLYESAGELLTRALSHRQRKHGETHAEIADSMAVLGRLRLAEGDFEKAEELLVRALEQRRSVLGAEHAETGRSTFDLATLRHQQGDLEAAEELFLESISILRSADDGGELLPRALSGLAAFERERGQYEVAEERQREALGAMIEVRGSAPDPTVARLRSGLGTLLRRQGDFEAAKAEYLEALASQRQLYPEGHPDIATTLSHLSSVAVRQGRFDEADQLLDETVRIRLERLGPAHPLVANTLNNRANLAADQGRLENAEELYREALKLLEPVLPAGHKNIAKFKTNLGLVLAEMERFEEADTLHREALASYRALYGESHASVAVVANNLGKSLRAQERYGEARGYYEQAVATLRRVLGDDHPQLAVGLNNLATVCRLEGEAAAAATYYDEAIAIAEKRLGGEHPTTFRFRLNRLLLAVAEEPAAEVEPRARELLEDCEAALDTGHRTIADARGLLGEVLTRLGHWQDAESQLVASLSELEALPSVSERALAKAQGRLDELARRRSAG